MKSARNYFSFFPRLLTLWVFLSLTLQGFAAVPLCFAETLANPLPDTGQTTFYDNSGVISEPAPGEPFYGQDASYLRARSYTKLDQYGNDLPFSASQWYQVRDNVTGLIWEVKNSRNGSADYGNPNDADNTYTWYDSNPATNGGYAGTPGAGTDTEDFINALNNASYGGHNDWRLPTVAELSLLTDLGTFDPAISADYFPQTVSSYYWSSTTYAGSTDVAWLVHFYDGYVRYDGKSYSYYVRAVRSGQPRSLDPLIINQNDPAIPEDDTVTDPNTGLMWQRYEGGEMAWSEALDYCQNLTLAGYDDWRLPDRHELQSLIDYARFGPALDESVFPEVVSSYYWSSTTNAFNTGYAWRVYFYNGYVRNISKSSSYYVRAVRSGQSGPLGHSAISVTPTSLDFGTAAVGADLVVRSVTVQNLGAADLILGSASITGPDAGVFALATDYDGYVLAPQAATPVEIAVAWLPIAGAADPSAQLNISSNDPVNPLVTVPLIGHLAGELSLNTVLDNYDLVFTTGGTGSWFGQTETAAYGGSAAQSMNINDDQASWVETEITGPATLTFLWRVSSEENYDFFECLLDGSPGLKMRISGDVAWQERTLAIPAGSHTVRWLYTKDYSVSSGADAAWLDRVRVEAGCQQTFYRDSDNDGYGDLYVSVAACATPTGYVVNSLDCNDNDADEHPDQIWYRDYDHDGYPADATNVKSCVRPYGYLTAGQLIALTGDWADNDNTVYPGAPEICDGKDNDQNGAIDDGAGDTWYRDSDGDGYGDYYVSVASCATPTGYVVNSLDCNDNDADEHPDQIWYRDYDHDGYPADATNVRSCVRPYGYLTAGQLIALTGDWADNDNTVYPGAPEICDGKDNDQNGAIDDGAGDTWYRDSDGDGYGDPTFSQQSCTQPAGYVENSSDCNDNNADEHPGQIWYRDADGDGYPSADTDTDSCQRPQGYLLASELIAVVFDADDNDNTVYPGAFEICDGKDNDQDGFDDEECGIVFVSGNGDCDGRPACYQTICAGYGYATAWDAGEIRVRDDFFIENLYLENDLLFTLSGGWNSDFSSNQGEQTSVSGTLTITAGTVIVEGIVLEGPATFTQLRKY